MNAIHTPVVRRPAVVVMVSAYVCVCVGVGHGIVVRWWQVVSCTGRSLGGNLHADVRDGRGVACCHQGWLVLRLDAAHQVAHALIYAERHITERVRGVRSITCACST